MSGFNFAVFVDSFKGDFGIIASFNSKYDPTAGIVQSEMRFIQPKIFKSEYQPLLNCGIAEQPFDNLLLRWESGDDEILLVLDTEGEKARPMLLPFPPESQNIESWGAVRSIFRALIVGFCIDILTDRYVDDDELDDESGHETDVERIPSLLH